MESIQGRIAHRRASHHVAAFVIALALAALPGRTLARVLLIGDSITQGAVSGVLGPPYADIVATDLGAGFDVLNLGCGGASSFDWRPDTGVTICAAGFIDLWAARVLPNAPAEIATVMLGTNDATGFFEPAPLTGANYGAMRCRVVRRR